MYLASLSCSEMMSSQFVRMHAWHTYLLSLRATCADTLRACQVHQVQLHVASHHTSHITGLSAHLGLGDDL